VGDTGLKAAVVGVGHLGRHHARILSSIEGATLSAVADISEPRAREIAAGAGARAYTDFRDLAGDVDLVSIATPTETHAEIASYFLERGIPVLVEKPLARTGPPRAQAHPSRWGTPNGSTRPSRPRGTW
jgi:predicted dehydrogenase